MPHHGEEIVLAHHCQYEKDGLKAKYPTPPYVVVTGSCHWLRPEAADTWAKSVGCPTVLGQGGIPFDPGHRKVVNWLHGVPFPHWDSYLDYCVGYRGPALAPDPAKAESLKKQIQELRMYVAGRCVEAALQELGDKGDDRRALADALHEISVADTPRGPIRFDRYGNVVGEFFIRRCERRDGQLVNTIIKTYSDLNEGPHVGRGRQLPCKSLVRGPRRSQI